MLHRRLLDALDAASPLLFLEAVPGSGRSTVLRQWESRALPASGELRLLFDARHVPFLRRDRLQVLLSALRHKLGEGAGAFCLEEEVLRDSPLRFLRDLGRPVSIGILEADHMPVEVFDAALALLPAGVRLLVVGVDVSPLVRRAEELGHYFTLLGETDVQLTLEETRALVAERGVELTEHAAATLRRATYGHPGMILSSLDALPVDSAAGLITRDRALAAFLMAGAGNWGPAPFAAFLGLVLQTSRFTSREAESLTDPATAARYLHRMVALGLGTRVWHDGLRTRVFRWDASIREMLLHSSLTRPTPTLELDLRLVEAARRTGDHELLITALVSRGQLAEAEELLAEQIWDVLPDSLSSLWAPLQRISPLSLEEHPSLLLARLRLSPHRSESPVSLRAALRALRTHLETTGPDAPWGRMGHLAHAFALALYAGERTGMIEVFTRLRALIADLAGTEAAEAARPRDVSVLMLVVDTAFRSGNAIPAAEIARFVVQVIETDPARLDPRGLRTESALRVILHDHRARGLEDGLDPEPLLAGSQRLHRDVDVLAAAMCFMWEAMDEGDFEAADGYLQAATARLSDPEGLPLLQLMRAHIAVYRQAPAKLATYASAYERATLSVPQHFAQSSHSQMQRITDFLARQLGRPLPSPGFLPASPVPGRVFYPRTEFTVLLMESLYALREGRMPSVRVALGKATALTPRRDLGLYVLSHATAEEITELVRLSHEVPGGESLRLERAMRFAGHFARRPFELSDREREVLELLRRGATNPEMAEAMFVSVNTVKSHRLTLMRKLGATNRDEALAAADHWRL
ncbi:helix-turn-helix transcriptional regulator [Brachybacterium sp. J144]|uniref:helix-turn-helix transcriptional regulator n=1 Tax=Brachybacterium sp. J144 TaxID=3116487 RepID=UPI002E7909B0|nr:helix-turn-helix transcriptional regulator [Brachybacterium sp. J144]MEE1650233.1 helix-turn-helix transcriptional regulator [Brachybacterium sp. J144]